MKCQPLLLLLLQEGLKLLKLGRLAAGLTAQALHHGHSRQGHMLQQATQVLLVDSCMVNSCQRARRAIPALQPVLWRAAVRLAPLQYLVQYIEANLSVKRPK